MEKCKDCINYDVCQYHIDEETEMTVNECSHGFKDKSRFIELPCELGETVYHITTCKNFSSELDGTLYDSNGGYGSATGYYCPCELRDNCPFDNEEDFDCDALKTKAAIFEDTVKGIFFEEFGIWVYLEYSGNVSLSDFGKTVFLPREEAERVLEGANDENGEM